VPDVDRALQVELFDERREVVRVSVHLVAIPRLARTAVTAPVMGDTAVTARGEKQHLIFPRVSA
jgi:hypothetical protein